MIRDQREAGEQIGEPNTVVHDGTNLRRGARVPRQAAGLRPCQAGIAVFIALAGSSHAALRITGKNVPKDALTGR